MMQKTIIVAIAALVLSAVSQSASAQVVPNGSFDEGVTTPTGWQLSGGVGTWEKEGRTADSRCISVTGDGKSSNYWKCPSVVLEPGKIYRINFWTKSSPDAGGEFVITGNPSCNFDWGHANKWTYRTTTAKVPPYRPEQQFIRFGQWHATGKVYFDDIGVTEVQAVHLPVGRASFSEGERIWNNQYEFVMPLKQGINIARPLAECTAPFDTDRWRLTGDARLVFRHEVSDMKGPAYRLSGGRVKTSVIHWARGLCVVEASRDGETWTHLGQIDKDGAAEFRLPDEFEDSTVVLVRLYGEKKEDEKRDPSLQVDGYMFSATLDHQTLMNITGKTQFLPARPPASQKRPEDEDDKGRGAPADKQ